LINILSKSHIKGRGSSIVTANKFDKNLFVADEGERVEDRESTPTNYIEIFPRTIINEVPSPDIPINWSMNPYQGCEHGCAYCYARPTHEYWGYNGGVDFEQKVMVKKEAVRLLQEKFESRSWTGQTIMLSGNTDCYQPAERKYKITRELLDLCLQYRNPVGIITKNSLITRDLDILNKMAKLNLIHVVLSITTLDESLRSILEPRTSSTKNKLKAIKQLTENNIPVSVMMAPIIPSINDNEIMSLAKVVSEAGAQRLNYTIVRLNGCVETVFSDWLRRHFPDRMKKVMDKIANCHGGEVADSRFKTRMKGEGNFSKIISQQFNLARQKFGLQTAMPPLNSKLFVRKNQFALDL
jgi:DNA repair photolyase